jgi:hypothetical protein
MNFVLYLGHLGGRELVVQPTTLRNRRLRMKRIFSLLAVTALMVAMLLASALPAFAASDNASCVGQTASGANAFRPGLGGAAISNLAQRQLVDDVAQANKENCPGILLPL